MPEETPSVLSTPHRYFVSYAHPSGFGCTEIALRLPVRSLKDIEVLRDAVAKGTGDSPGGIAILNYIPFPKA